MIYITKISIKEIEEERKSLIKHLPEILVLSLNQIKEKFLNPYGYRETLHTSMILQENTEHYLVKHPTIILDKKAYEIAYKASLLLADLYQRLGELEQDSINKIHIN